MRDASLEARSFNVFALSVVSLRQVLIAFFLLVTDSRLSELPEYRSSEYRPSISEGEVSVSNCFPRALSVPELGGEDIVVSLSMSLLVGGVRSTITLYSVLANTCLGVMGGLSEVSGSLLISNKLI